MGIHVLIRSFRIYVHNNSGKMLKGMPTLSFCFIIYMILLSAALNEYSLNKVIIRVIVYENWQLMMGSNSLSAPRFIRPSATIIPVSDDV